MNLLTKNPMCEFVCISGINYELVVKGLPYFDSFQPKFWKYFDEFTNDPEGNNPEDTAYIWKAIQRAVEHLQKNKGNLETFIGDGMNLEVKYGEEGLMGVRIYDTSGDLFKIFR